MASLVVVGSGCAGLFAAKAALDAGAHVTIIEKDETLGGHALTFHDPVAGDVDLGFMVCNEHTYPNFMKLFDTFHVQLTTSEMSLSTFDSEEGTSWSFRSTEFLWLLRNLWRPRLWHWVAQYKQLTRIALPYLKKCEFDSKEAEQARQQSLSEVCSTLSSTFLDNYLFPLVAAVWSAEEPKKAAAAPILAFLRNHRLLWPQCASLQWLTPRHGSHDYVKHVRDYLLHRGATIMTHTTASSIDRKNKKLVVVSQKGKKEIFYDKLILSTHAPDAKKIKGLGETQKRWLEHFKISKNEVALWVGKEAAKSYMPKNPADWSSWNTSTKTREEKICQVTYWLSLIQDTRNPFVFVTLNHDHKWEQISGPPRVSIAMAHPVLDIHAFRGQNSQDTVQGQDEIFFCGAWLRNGFHEDGAVSGLLAARRALKRADIPIEFVTEDIGCTQAKPVVAYAEHSVPKSKKGVFCEKQYFYLWDSREPPPGYDRGDYCLPSAAPDNIDQPLDTTLRQRFFETLGWWPVGSIEVCGHIRSLGCGFNSFILYIARGDPVTGLGSHPSAMMVEVHNVPWGESVLYSFNVNSDGSTSRATVPKTMHVSPFHTPPSDTNAFVYDFTVNGFEAPGSAGIVDIVLRNAKELDSADYKATLRVLEHGKPGSKTHSFAYGSWRSVSKIYARAISAVVTQGRGIHAYDPPSVKSESTFMSPQSAEAVSALFFFGIATLLTTGTMKILTGLLAIVGFAFLRSGSINALTLVLFIMLSIGYILYTSLMTNLVFDYWPAVVFLLLNIKSRLACPSPATKNAMMMRRHRQVSIYALAASLPILPLVPSEIRIVWYSVQFFNLKLINTLASRILIALLVVLYAFTAKFYPFDGIYASYVVAIASGFLLCRAAISIALPDEPGIYNFFPRFLSSAGNAFLFLVVLSILMSSSSRILDQFPVLAIMELCTAMWYLLSPTSTRRNSIILFHCFTLVLRILCAIIISYTVYVAGTIVPPYHVRCPAEISNSSHPLPTSSCMVMSKLRELILTACVSALLLGISVLDIILLVRYIKTQASQVFANILGVELHEKKIDLIQDFTTSQQPRNSPNVILQQGISAINFFLRVVSFGELEFGESYVRGEWIPTNPSALSNVGEHEHLYEVLYTMAKDPSTSSFVNVVDLFRQLNPLRLYRLFKFKKGFSLQTKTSRKTSIEVHYNDESAVIRSFLDKNCVYTCARFTEGKNATTETEMTLEDAQVRKVDRLLDLGRCFPGSKVLDIGCGWGYLASRAQERGAIAMGVCNCEEMIQNARRIHLNETKQNSLFYEFCDYKELPLIDSALPRFDLVTAVEMIEAVPRSQYKDFAEACWRCLSPGGRVVMQAIHARPYNNIVASKKNPDLMGTFVTTHIFPGQQLPNLDWLFEVFSKTGFRRVYIESNRHDYALTLKRWADNLELHADKFDEQVLRKYRYYLAFCRAGFASEMLDLAVIVWEKI